MKKLTTTERFNAIAALTIYICTDSKKGSAARAALAVLLKNDDPLFIDTTPEFRRDLMNGDYGAWDLQAEYNKLLKEIILDEEPSWSEFIDRYGAHGFLDENGVEVFSGDAAGAHQFFTDIDAVLARLSLQDSGVRHGL